MDVDQLKALGQLIREDEKTEADRKRQREQERLLGAYEQMRKAASAYANKVLGSQAPLPGEWSYVNESQAIYPIGGRRDLSPKDGADGELIYETHPSYKERLSYRAPLSYSTATIESLPHFALMVTEHSVFSKVPAKPPK